MALSGWEKGRGALGPLAPLTGSWTTNEAAEGSTPARQMACTREFSAFGTDWVRLEADWRMGDRPAYREIALFGKGEDGTLACHSFTNDGKHSTGRLSDGSDVHPDAVAFEAEMKAGVARMVYWPREDGEAGFHFAVENRVKAGWNRFLIQTFGPANCIEG
jgi:hypothetical protein